MVLSSKSGAEALLLLLLPAVSSHLDDSTSSDRHRQTRHIHPTPEPTPEPTQEPTAKSEPASAETGEFSSWTAWGSRGNTSPDQNILDSNSEVWIAAASSPPIAAATNAPQTPIYDEITTDQLMNMDEIVAGNAQSATGPLYALRHGRGAFAITGGTGCYRGARGQAQANFGAQSSHVHLFVPSISLEVDDIRVGENGMGPQDTTWNRDRRMQGAQECNLFREGADSFTIMSLDLERRSNPPDTKFIQESGSSYHEHGAFWAQEEWFEGISGEYSLSCVHHECLLSFHFGIGPSTSDSSSTTEKKRTLANDEDGGDGDHSHQTMTSLSLQGTTELAFQGEHTDLLVCVENCGEMGSTYSSEIAVDVEHYEAINLRNFDNTESLVQLDSNGKGKGKGKECYINTNVCLVLGCSGKGKSGSKGTSTSGCSGKGKSGKNGGKNRKRRLKSSCYDISDYVPVADDTNTVCTDITGTGTCVGGECSVPDTMNVAPMALNDIYTSMKGQLFPDNIDNSIFKQDADFLTDHGVMLNDYDPDGDLLTTIAVNQDANNVGKTITLSSGANLKVEANGKILYYPGNVFKSMDTGDFATESFEYTIADSHGHTGSATVTIVIEGTNDSPMAVDDTEETTEDAILSSNALLNDSDPEGHPLVVETMNGSQDNIGQEIVLPSGALVTLSSDGTYTFDPNGHFESLNGLESASETFDYTIKDGFGGTASATVSIIIAGVNDPPMVPDVDLGLNPARSTISYNLLDNVIDPEDPEQNCLSVTEVESQSIGNGGSNSITLSSGLVVTIDGSTGDTVIDPDGQFDSMNADDTAQLNFDYVVADCVGATGSGIVTLTLVGQDTSAPSDVPSDAPSDIPSDVPSDAPSDIPSDVPSDVPSDAPTKLFVCPDETTNAATQGTIFGSNASGSTTSQTLQFDLFASAFTSSGNACIEGLIGVKPPFNILFVIDVSGSTRKMFSGTAVGDVNGDGISNTILDAQIDSILKVVDAIVSTPSLTNDNVNIGIVTFSTFASYEGNWPPADEGNPYAINPGLETTLKALRGRGYTNFDDALDKAIVYFEGSDSIKGGAPDVNTRTNRMYFLSDGLPTQCGDDDPNTAEDWCGADEEFNDFTGATVFTSELLRLGLYSVDNYAIGVGLDSDVSAGSGLDKIDNTENPKTGDKAVQVTTTDALTSIILESPVYAEVLDFRVELNGAVVADIDETSLVTGPNGYVLGVNEISGLESTNGVTNTLVATALLDFDGDPLTPNDQLRLRTVSNIIGTEGSGM